MRASNLTYNAQLINYERKHEDNTRYKVRHIFQF